MLKPYSSENSSSPVSISNPQDPNETSAGDKYIHDRPFLMDHLLTYMVFALQSATSDNVLKAVTGHFTVDEIIATKNALWAECGGDVIGVEAPRRRDSTARSLQDAHTLDISIALSKLDRADILPTVVIDAHSLGKIPLWHPEDLNMAPLADRMLRTENRLTMLQEMVDRNTAENLDLREKLDHATSYSSVTSGHEILHRSPPPPVGLVNETQSPNQPPVTISIAAAPAHDETGENTNLNGAQSFPGDKGEPARSTGT